MSSVVLYRSQELPWSLSDGQERRFRQILKHCAGVVLVLSILIPLLPVSEQPTDTTAELPQRYARLILEKKPPPPRPKPAPVIPDPVIPEIAAKKPEPKPVVQAKPDPKPEPKPMRVVTPEPQPVRNEIDAAREKASSSGLLALKDQLADLRNHDAVATVTAAGNLAAAAEPGRVSDRALITAGVAAGSGGVRTAALSRDTGGAALAGRQTTQVASPVTGGTASRRAAASAGNDSRAASGRSREDIEKVFDRNKAAIYALYNRALRKDPTLEGKVVLKLTIAASGKVTDCEIVSSDLSDSELERKLVQRISMFDFGAKDVDAVTITKPIDFLPA